MPRITVAAGATNAAAAPGEVGYVPPGEGVDGAVTPADAPAVDGPQSSDNAEQEPVSDPAEEHAGRPVAELKAELRERGLPVTGSKEQLVARLVEHDQAADARTDGES